MLAKVLFVHYLYIVVGIFTSQHMKNNKKINFINDSF